MPKPTARRRRGRPQEGVRLLERLEASEEAKRKLALFLKTLSGELTVKEAAGKVGVNESRFFKLRERWLRESLEGLEARVGGRKPRPRVEPEDESLRARVRELESALAVSRAREELAIALPGRLPGAAPKKGHPKGPIR